LLHLNAPIHHHKQNLNSPDKCYAIAQWLSANLWCVRSPVRPRLMSCGFCGGQRVRAWVLSGFSCFLPLSSFHQFIHHHSKLMRLSQSCLKVLN